METLFNSKIIITGINGFTGFHIADRLINLGAKVIGIGIEEKSFSFFKKNFNYHKVDLLNKSLIKKTLSKYNPDYIFHFAADSSSVGDPINKYRVNILGTEILLDAAESLNLINLKKIIIPSSAAVYGKNELICQENQILQPVSHYGISKLGVEKISNFFFKKLPIIVTRPFNYTGIGQSKHFVIPKITNAFKNNFKKIQLGNIDVLREFNSIEYVVDCYLKLLVSELNSLTVNVSSAKTYSIRQIIKECESISKTDIEIEINDSLIRPNEIKELYGSIEYLSKIIEIDHNKNCLKSTLKKMIF